MMLLNFSDNESTNKTKDENEVHWSIPQSLASKNDANNDRNNSQEKLKQSFRQNITSTSNRSTKSYYKRLKSNVKRQYRLAKKLYYNNKERIDIDQYQMPIEREQAYIFTKTERAVYKFSSWCYETSVFNVILFFVVLYFFFVFLFALVLLGIADYYRDIRGGRNCISGWDEIPNASFGNEFEFAMDLSWTTFSTVGYGLFSPEDSPGCWGIRITCAIEAFFGVLFASCCGATLYAKIGRTQAHAAVTFSSGMCLQYGDGVVNEFSSLPDVKATIRRRISTQQQNSSENSSEGRNSSFPFLEFRIVHNESEDPTEAIVDASITCHVIHAASVENLLNEGYIVPNFRHSSIVNEKPVGYREKFHFPGKVFDYIQVDNDKMPWFDKIWYVRHILDTSSPLLKPEIKEEILKNDNKWPSFRDDCKSIRDSLIEFQLLTVQLQGMSGITASSVYSQMIYEFDDIYVGWQFTGLLYDIRKPGQFKMFVDKSLVDDIVPQRGGGHESVKDR